MRVRKALPAQRRPTMRVPAIDVFTTGITPPNSDSNTLQQEPYYFINLENYHNNFKLFETKF